MPRIHLPRICLILSFALSLCGSDSARAQTICPPAWLPTFGGQPGTTGPVRALCTWDDGNGPALYLAGSFMSAGGAAATRVAKWDGVRFTKLGSGITGSVSGIDPAVHALAVFDDGSGPALFAAGNFSNAGGTSANNLAKWDGTSWTALGSGTDGVVYALCVHDDGGGNALYAAGAFVSAGGIGASKIARWDGSTWSGVGTGLAGSGNYVHSLAVYHDGGGSALFAGGDFDLALGAHDVARWDGMSWATITSQHLGTVYALSTFDIAGNSKLAFGGAMFAFPNAGSWDGSNMVSLGAGTNGPVFALEPFDDGSGNALYAGGSFTNATGSGAKSIAKWNGTQFSALGSGLSMLGGNGTAIALEVFDDGHGPALFVGGIFSSAGGVAATNIARWNGTSWSALGHGFDREADALATHDDGSGPALYAAGRFTAGDSVALAHVARRGANGWTPLGAGTNGDVFALLEHDDGGGKALYAAGAFTTPGEHIASWRSGAWSALGTGLNGLVVALAEYDDGGGLTLYAGGSFTSAGGMACKGIAKWDGGGWSALGAGFNEQVNALCVHDDGGGPALYAAGNFTLSGTSAMNRIARWNGTNWTQVGSGASETLWALCVHDDGTGPALYTGGRFALAPGPLFVGVVRWGGTSWSAVGPAFTLTSILALASHDFGSGSALYAGGSFSLVGGVPANDMASWDGTNWSAMGSGTQDSARALLSFRDGSGPALYAAGSFGACPDSGDSFVAKWAPPSSCVSIPQVLCEPGVGGVIACPCSNPPSGLDRGCDNSIASGGARLIASGSASLVADTFQLGASGELPSALSAVLQGNAVDATGLVFGQGVRCIHGVLKRLYVRSATQGALSIPNAADPSISARSATLGDTIQPGTPRYYGVYYRDPSVAGSCAATSTYNITQQLGVIWQP